jgi:hypothetical protein
MNDDTPEPTRSSNLVPVIELVFGGGFGVVWWYLKRTTSTNGRKVSLLNNTSPLPLP